MQKRKVALIILDGWGLGEPGEHNGIHMARTPFFDKIWAESPHTTLQASGEFVGLPAGQIGGSEVGHMTIGAGRVRFTELPRISRSFDPKFPNESILKYPNFLEFIDKAKMTTPHLIGLVSTSGVHAHQEHLFSLLRLMKKYGCKSPIIHFISDGRDTYSKSGVESAEKLIALTRELKYGRVATLTGRFFTMDRDKNIDRTTKGVNLIVTGATKEHVQHADTWEDNLVRHFHHKYQHDETDEFIEPTLIDPDYKGIKVGEPLFFFNFRSDRMKQPIVMIHEMLPDNPIYTITNYDKSYEFPVIFEKQLVTNTIGEVLSKNDLTQLRATETEKFPHVTYFFNGITEVVFPGEIRVMAESNKVKHDMAPEMKAHEIAENAIEVIKNRAPDFILINFANPDMVGHTGNVEAIIRGVEKVDVELKRICGILTKEDYICCITADHGNADVMWTITEKGEKAMHTAHTMNPVPFIVYDPSHTETKQLQLDQNPDNGLSRIAATVLQLMSLSKPEEYDESLIA